MRKRKEQINFRCDAHEKDNYNALSEALDLPLTVIIRQALSKLVDTHVKRPKRKKR